MEADYLIPFLEGTWSLISNMSEMIMEKKTRNVSQKNKHIFGKWKESPEFPSCHMLNWEPFRWDYTLSSAQIGCFKTHSPYTHFFFSECASKSAYCLPINFLCDLAQNGVGFSWNWNRLVITLFIIIIFLLEIRLRGKYFQWRNKWSHTSAEREWKDV